MASEFDLATYQWEQAGVLLTPVGAVPIPIVLYNAARSLALYTDYRLLAGTPVCKVASQTYYMPVRRDTSYSAAYDSGADETTITLTNSAHPFKIGDTIQTRTGADDTPETLGAIVDIDYMAKQVVVAGDKTTEAVDGDYIDVTESATADGALILIQSVDVYNGPQRTAVDTPTVALAMGAVNGATLLGPLSYSDLQLIADLPHIYVHT